VSHFISRRIRTVQQVEVLRLLRSDPAREWTVQDLSTRLRIVPDRDWLEGLAADGLVDTGPDGYRYRAGEGAVDELVALFDSHRPRVVRAIYATPRDDD
jgi:hypothetical protein